MSSDCKVCAAWHDGRETGECGHWCHFVDFDADTAPRGQDGQAGDE